MLKEFLSGFYKTTQPSYQPDTFGPYFSIIFTVIVITVVGYSAQMITTTIHTYANKPISFENNILQKQECKDLSKGSLMYLCGELSINVDKDYISELSFEQDLHNPTK